MSRHSAVAASVLAGLLLCACSAGRPSAETSNVGRVAHIGPYTQIFASPLPANARQAAVLRGFRQAQVLWMRAEVARRLQPSVRQYVTGQAFKDLTSAVRADRTRDLVPAGTDRFFMTRATAVGARAATVTTCDDGSEFREQNPRTKKVDPAFSPGPGQQYLSETWRMSKVGGHWAITGLSAATLPSRNAEHCQPGMAAAVPPRRPNVTALVAAMNAALLQTRSVHMTGTISVGGKTVTMNVGITRADGFSGQISENGARLTVLSTHGHSYIKLNAAFLRLAHLPASACNHYCGKYLELTAQQSQSMLTGLRLSNLMRSISSTRASKFSYLGAVVVNGRPAWLLQDSRRNSIYIARHGRPYLLVAISAPPGLDTLRLTEWNAVTIPGPPPRARVVQLRQIVGGPQTDAFAGT